MQNVAIRPASLNDLPTLTEIHNYYVLNTHITFDIQPFSTDQRRSCGLEHPKEVFTIYSRSNRKILKVLLCCRIV